MANLLTTPPQALEERRFRLPAPAFNRATGAAIVALNEPLLASAPLAKSAAQELCRRRTGSGAEDNCSWYHGYWQYLRILGIVAASERHAGFYADALGALAADGNYRRILVSTSADYAMLAHLLQAYGDALENIAVTVADVCETPLMLCNWYAERLGLEIETEAHDIPHWETEQRFDLIVTHSFLPMLPAAARQTLVAKWHHLLRPGGKIVSVTRINPDWTEADITPAPERVRGFRENALAEALKLQSVLDIDARQLAEGAENYMRHLKFYSLTSEDELRTLFAEAEFIATRG